MEFKPGDLVIYKSKHGYPNIDGNLAIVSSIEKEYKIWCRFLDKIIYIQEGRVEYKHDISWTSPDTLTLLERPC